MINNQWYIVLSSRELKAKKPLKLKRFNEDLAIWRDHNGKVNCIADRCCHRGVSLSCGGVVDGKLECPFHGFLYDGRGAVKLIPANGKNAKIPHAMKVKSYQAHEEYGFIWLWYGDHEKINSKPFFFTEVEKFSYSEFKDHWNVHYSRAIENQLDVVHLPFVHKTTIGRGNKTLVHGPVVVREQELITFYVNNIVDDGKTTALKPNEVKDYKKLFHLQFHYPNIWQNFITEKIRIIAAFVPVDDENTCIYIRYYQNITKAPLAKHFINYIGKLSSMVILRQDKRIVITQQPKKTTLKMDEILIMGDKPIIEYRKHRNNLIEMSKRE